jgi:hypothetical protein
MTTKRARLQTGSICAIGSSWYVRYSERRNIGGEIVKKKISHKLGPVTTRGKHPPAEIIAAAREHMAGINDRKVPASRNLKLVDFVEQVFLPSIKQEQRPSTHQSYAALWALHIKPHATDDNGREMWLQRVRTPDCQRWLKAIAKDEIPGTSTRLSLNSLRRVKSVISGIFATARAPGLLRRHQSGSGHED